MSTLRSVASVGSDAEVIEALALGEHLTTITRDWPASRLGAKVAASIGRKVATRPISTLDTCDDSDAVEIVYAIGGAS